MKEARSGVRIPVLGHSLQMPYLCANVAVPLTGCSSTGQWVVNLCALVPEEPNRKDRVTRIINMDWML
jgi:hypothetical protein